MVVKYYGKNKKIEVWLNNALDVIVVYDTCCMWPTETKYTRGGGGHRLLIPFIKMT